MHTNHLITLLFYGTITNRIFRHTIKEKRFEIRLKSSLNKAAVIGGDKRQTYLSEILKREGYEVITYGVSNIQEEKALSLKDALCDVNIIAAPVPFFKNGEVFSQEKKKDLTAEGILQYAPFGCKIFAGSIPQTFLERAREKGISCVDYLKDNYGVIQNTIAVAEGTLAEAIKRSEENLYRSSCLVMGYGRCGSILVSYLKRMSCQVAVYEKEDALRARAALIADDIVNLRELPAYLERAQYIFNTVPSMVLPKALLGYVSENALILDLASAPGGVDYAEAERRGIQAVQLPGIPGKYAPMSSAKILGEVIKRELKESK